jgi:hypothetical protein
MVAREGQHEGRETNARSKVVPSSTSNSLVWHMREQARLLVVGEDEDYVRRLGGWFLRRSGSAPEGEDSEAGKNECGF